MIYVDTSVIVTLLTAEPKTQDVIAWYSALGESPTSSDWLLTEFASAVSIKLCTTQISEADAKQVCEEFRLLVGGGLRIAR